MNKQILLDPHVDDFVFRPVSFLLMRRKALKKYSYIADALLDGGDSIPIYFSYKTSSLPLDFLPAPLKMVAIFFEVLVWKVINRGYRFKTVKIEDSQSVFFFGYKKIFDVLKLLEKKEFVGKILIHLSHYHTFDVKLANICNKIKGQIELCYDNNVSDYPYFKEKAPWYEKQVRVVPFCIGERFFEQELPEKKLANVAVTGTYHDFDPRVIPDWGIYNRGRLTLHPIRHELALRLAELPENFDVRMSLFDTSVNQFRKFFSLSQKVYFSFDISEFYLKRKAALVAGEGTGAIAIGAIEAMASGCVVVLTNTEIKDTFIEQGRLGFVLYDGSLEDAMNAVELAIDDMKYSQEDIRAIAAKYRRSELKEYFLREFIW